MQVFNQFVTLRFTAGEEIMEPKRATPTPAIFFYQMTNSNSVSPTPPPPLILHFDREYSTCLHIKQLVIETITQL